ncbi:MAG: hypothetical protein HDQ98_13750 [Lachnospiraceae bacterium]|nr:hypothetical protein [Lachnospiraceae bacterium]
MQHPFQNLTDDDGMSRPFDTPSVIVNCFDHEQIKKSVQKEGTANA